VLTNMSNLIEKLNIQFNKQPSHMKKIYACLNELSNEADLTLDRLKLKVLPLLKGNQLLIDWFMQLFDRPTNSLPDEHEIVHIKKSMSDSESSADNHEEIVELIESENNDFGSCGVKYINGKVMYRGRTLFPAKITFLAHDAPLYEGKKNRIPSLCVHEIRRHVKFSEAKKAEDAAATATSIPKKKLRTSRRYKLCDQQTHHAHAVRLNTIHLHSNERLSDLAPLLIPPPPTPGGDDKQHSPRKSAKAAKKAGNSPVNQKKNLSKSPSSSSGNSVTSTSPSNGSPSSKALQTAKRLKSLVEETNEDQAKKKAKVTDDAIDQPSTSRMESKISEDVAKPDGSWTRDEDKMILEEIKAGYSSKDELLGKLCKKLARALPEISTRYEFLLDLLMMMKT